MPNSLKGPKIILDMGDRHISKDGPFRILGNALTYLLSDFFGITFLFIIHMLMSDYIRFRMDLFYEICIRQKWIFLGFVTSLLGSQPTDDISHKPCGRVPILSPRSVVTFPAKDITEPNKTAACFRCLFIIWPGNESDLFRSSRRPTWNFLAPYKQ